MKLNNIQQCVRAFCLSGMWKSQSAFLNALLNEQWLAVNPNSLQSPRGMLDIGGMNCGECDMSTSGKQWDQSVCVCVFKKVVFENCKEIWNHVGNMLVKLDIFSPNFRGKKIQKCLSCHHLYKSSEAINPENYKDCRAARKLHLPDNGLADLH